MLIRQSMVIWKQEPIMNKNWINELMKCFTPVFGGAVSGGIWIYGVIEKAPMLITVGCVLFGLEIVCNYFIRR